MGQRTGNEKWFFPFLGTGVDLNTGWSEYRWIMRDEFEVSQFNF